MQSEKKSLHPDHPNVRISGVVPKKKPSMNAFLSIAPLFEMITERMGGGFKLSHGEITLFASRRYEEMCGSDVCAAQRISIEFEESEAVLTILASVADEKRMAHLTRLALLGEVSEGMVHDMNNLLTVFDGNTYFLSQSLAGRSSHVMKELVEDMAITLEAMKGICERTQRLSSKKKPEEVNLNELVESAIRLMKAPLRRARKDDGKEIRIVNQVPSAMVAEAVYSDLQNAVLNIMLNAVRHGIQEEGQINIQATTCLSTVILSIENDGVPVPESIQDSLLKEPLSVDCDNGVGLYFSAKNLESSGGRISFVSEPERTTFFIILPIPSDIDG